MKREIFDKHYIALAISFGHKIDPARAELLFNDLSSFSQDDVINAMNVCRLKCQFMPNTSEIIAEIQPLDASRSWARVYRIAQNGCRRWQELSDVEVATVSAIGGMREIQNADDKSIHFLSQSYLKAFNLMRTRQVNYENDSMRLSDLNADPETARFLKPQEHFVARNKVTGGTQIKSLMSGIIKDMGGVKNEA